MSHEQHLGVGVMEAQRWVCPHCGNELVFASPARLLGVPYCKRDHPLVEMEQAIV